MPLSWLASASFGTFVGISFGAASGFGGGGGLSRFPVFISGPPDRRGGGRRRRRLDLRLGYGRRRWRLLDDLLDELDVDFLLPLDDRLRRRQRGDQQPDENVDRRRGEQRRRPAPLEPIAVPIAAEGAEGVRPCLRHGPR